MSPPSPIRIQAPQKSPHYQNPMAETRYDIDHHEHHESRNRKSFEEEALDAKSRAIFIASLHFGVNFLHILSLTWATVALLGGFVAVLRRWDLFLVTFVLVSQTIWFLSFKATFKASSFAIPVKQKENCVRISRYVKLASFILEEVSPVSHNDKENVLQTSRYWRLINCMLEDVSLVSLILISHRLYRRRAHPLSHHSTENLVPSLLIFYILELILSFIDIIFNSAISTMLQYYIYHTFLQGDSFVLWYISQVVQETIAHGPLKANEIKISDLVVRRIARHIEIGKHPLEVIQYNERPIHYIYDQPGAVDRICEYLKSEDLWIRAAASSMPGFWVTRKKIKLQKELFWKLRERMYGGGRDAECAIRSAKLLAAYWVEESVDLRQEYPFLVDDPVAGTNIVDTLVNIVLERIRPTLLFQVKALAACCRHHLVKDYFHHKLILEVNGKLEDISKEKVGQVLQELIVSATKSTPPSGQISAVTRTAAPGRRGNDNKEMDFDKQLILTSRLGQLCMKLCEIICPSNMSVQFVTKIYASEALLCLLLHYGTPILDRTRPQLQNVVKDMKPSQRLESHNIDLEDIESMERVRQVLSLEQFSEWKRFKVSGIDEHGNFSDGLSQEFVEKKVKHAREGVAH